MIAYRLNLSRKFREKLFPLFPQLAGERLFNLNLVEGLGFDLPLVSFVGDLHFGWSPDEFGIRKNLVFFLVGDVRNDLSVAAAQRD